MTFDLFVEVLHGLLVSVRVVVGGIPLTRFGVPLCLWSVCLIAIIFQNVFAEIFTTALNAAAAAKIRVVVETDFMPFMTF